MAITYTWKVTGLKTKNIDADRQNAVVQTYWQKIGVDGNGNEGVFQGATPFTVDPTDTSGPFIPFDQLTESDVLDWIKAIVVGSYEEHVNGQILKQIEENTTNDVALPWANN